MPKISVTFAAAVAFVAAMPAFAEMTGPDAPQLALVVAGAYKVDSDHTQVTWTVEHLGISRMSCAFGAGGGKLEIDPARPSAAKVTVAFNIADMTTTVPAFTGHLSAADLFDVEKFPTATFTSTTVVASGESFEITGNLTIKGLTKL